MIEISWVLSCLYMKVTLQAARNHGTYTHILTGVVCLCMHLGEGTHEIGFLSF